MAAIRYTRELLEEAARETTNFDDAVRWCGGTVTPGSRSYLRQKMAREGIDTSHFTTRRTRHMEETLREVVAASSAVTEDVQRQGISPISGSHPRDRHRALAQGGAPAAPAKGAVSDPCDRVRLAAAIAEASNWTDLMRRLGLKKSGGRRRVLQEKATGYGLDTSHFKQRSPWRKYTDEAIAAATASSSTLREVVAKLGAPPATGTLSHIGRRITAAGIDVSHFPGMNRHQLDLLFTTEELQTAAASADSIRGVARRLGVPDDGRSRAAVAGMLRRREIATSHFRNARLAVNEDGLRAAVPQATSYAAVMRTLGLEVNDTNHRRVRRKVLQLKLDTSHFKRRSWGTIQVHEPQPVASKTLVIMPCGSARTNRARLHRALQEIGVPHQCTSCGSIGEWLGQPITLQIDHINGDWLDNQAENLRYLCPNCHAITSTWCRGGRSRAQR